MAKLEPAEQVDALDALEQYDAGCLENPDTDNGLDADIARTLGGAVGVLVSTSDDRVYCTATRMTKDLLLTARHCVFTDTTSARSQLRSPNEIRFYGPRAPGTAVPILDIIHPAWARNSGTVGLWMANEDLHDYALLRTAVDTHAIRMKLGEPRDFDRLLMFGFQANTARIVELRRMLNRPIPPAPTSGPMRWRSSLRFDKSATCSIGQMKTLPGGACLLHGCQTEGGTSGAPLFRIDGNDLVLVGLHTRSFASEDQGTCAIAELTALGNVGLKIGADVATVMATGTP